MEITSAEKHKPKGPDPSSSMASLPLKEDKLNSSTKPGESNNNGNINDGVEMYKEKLYKALQSGDWNAVKELLNFHPHAISAKFADDRTALHVAVVAGHVHIVEELVNLMSEENLKIKDSEGFTALARAAYIGNYSIAEFLLRKNKDFISITNIRGTIPVFMALYNCHLKLGRYLYSQTPLEILEANNGKTGASLLCVAIYNNALDIALDLVQRCPRLAVAKAQNGESPSFGLACMPDLLISRYRLVFWKRWIYSS